MLALFSGKTYVRIANAWDVTDLPGTDGTGDRRYTAHWDFNPAIIAALDPTPNADFLDVSRVDWFYYDVRYVCENGLMNGTSGSTFSPLENLTRAQLTAVLYRMDGSPAVSGTCSFTDAKRGAYYADALVWAERNALVNGYGSGAFGVGDAITREQLVTILYRYAAYKGIDVSARADLSGYRDAEKISGYARDAFGWAVEAGLIRGSGDLLNPQGRTTRAEYAAIAARFHKTFIAK